MVIIDKFQVSKINRLDYERSCGAMNVFLIEYVFNF